MDLVKHYMNASIMPMGELLMKSIMKLVIMLSLITHCVFRDNTIRKRPVYTTTEIVTPPIYWAV